jgi:hypothetical protein
MWGIRGSFTVLAETGSHLSNSVDRSTQTASRCVMLLPFGNNSGWGLSI